MRPTQMLDYQADLLHRLTTDEEFQRFARDVFAADAHSAGLLDDMEDVDGVTWRYPSGGKIPHEKRGPIMGDGWRQVFTRSVQRADVYRVSAEMSALAVHLARNEVNETDVWSHDLAPSPYGMVFFEEPLVLADVRGVDLRIDYLVWGQAAFAPHSRTTGTGIYLLSDLTRPDAIARQIIEEQGARAVHKLAGRWGISFGDIMLDGDRLGVSSIDINEALWDKDDDQWVNVQAPNPRHILYALWTLMGQTITNFERGVVPPKMRRRFRQMRLPARVTVVTLRHAQARGAGTETVVWRHKWIVKGHLRWQPYGKRLTDHTHVYGAAEVDNSHSVRFCTVSGCDHRLVRMYIAPYVKGPENAPLIQTTKVYDLRR